MEQQKRPRGRPPTPPEERHEQRSMRLQPHLWAKIDAAGIEAFRAYLERWKPKPPKE